ncbi:hypothetical protein ACU4GD_13355 [Cupriavidus basilensis]
MARLTQVISSGGETEAGRAGALTLARSGQSEEAVKRYQQGRGRRGTARQPGAGVLPRRWAAPRKAGKMLRRGP